MKRSEFLKLSALVLAAIQTGAAVAKKTYEDFKPEPLEDLHRYKTGGLHIADCLALPNEVLVCVLDIVRHNDVYEVRVAPLSKFEAIGHLPKHCWILNSSMPTVNQIDDFYHTIDYPVFRLYQHVSETRAGHSTTLLLECNKTKKEST